jgi:hypothetical protein
MLLEHDLGCRFVVGGDVMPEPLLNEPPKEASRISRAFGGCPCRGADELEAVMFALAHDTPFLGLFEQYQHAASVPKILRPDVPKRGDAYLSFLNTKQSGRDGFLVFRFRKEFSV